MFIPHAFTTLNESDFERIVCLVISFLDTHEYLTQKMLRGENKTQENAVIIREFLKIDCKIIREMGENLEFGQELKKSYFFLKNQEKLIKEKVGPYLYNSTVKGLLLIAFIYRAAFLKEI